MNLPNGSVTFTVAARTLPTSPFPSRRYTGTAQVTVNGGGSGGGNSGGLPSSRANAFGNLGADNASNLPYGERLVPTNAILRRLKYKPIPVSVAHQQFLPTNGFSLRNYLFYHPSKAAKAGSGGGFVLIESPKLRTWLADTRQEGVYPKPFPRGDVQGVDQHRGTYHSLMRQGVKSE